MKYRRQGWSVAGAYAGKYFSGFGEQEFYPAKEERGTWLEYTLIPNYAFVDGNKRIGIYAMLTDRQWRTRWTNLWNRPQTIHCPLDCPLFRQKLSGGKQDYQRKYKAVEKWKMGISLVGKSGTWSFSIILNWDERHVIMEKNQVLSLPQMMESKLAK